MAFMKVNTTKTSRIWTASMGFCGVGCGECGGVSQHWETQESGLLIFSCPRARAVRNVKNHHCVNLCINSTTFIDNAWGMMGSSKKTITSPIEPPSPTYRVVGILESSFRMGVGRWSGGWTSMDLVVAESCALAVKPPAGYFCI